MARDHTDRGERQIRSHFQNLHPVMTPVIFAVGLAGALAARAIGLPLPMLLGSVLGVAVLSIAGMRPGGETPAVPPGLRMLFIPIIGLSIGAAFTPDVLSEALRWWPSLLALTVYIPLVHFLGFQVFRRLGRLSPVTAYYASIPGGLIESIAMGEEKGADAALLTLLQFLRLILAMMLVPLGFSLLSGGAVGSAAGVVMGDTAAPVTLFEIAVQAVLGAIGFFVGRRLALPAYVITGPIIMSALGHLGGLVAAAPPGWLIEVTQLVIGVGLGTRFAGMPPRFLAHGLALALVTMALTMLLAVCAALVLYSVVDQPVEAVILAFAPGGLAEMSLVALSLQVSVIYVTTHHVARIVLSVTVARLFEKLVIARAD